MALVSSKSEIISRFSSAIMKLQPRNLMLYTFASSSLNNNNSTSSASKMQKVPNVNPKWVSFGGHSFPTDSAYNLSPKVIELVGRNLHLQDKHPLCLVKNRIADFFRNHRGQNVREGKGCESQFSLFDTMPPFVTTRQNFDSLLVPSDHVSRRASDSYYINEQTLLRSHTSAHQVDILSAGYEAFLVAGDVYRRDDIDALHYPAFHQIEGVRLFSADELFFGASDPSGSLVLFEANRQAARLASPPIMAPTAALLDRQPRHTIETVLCLEHQLKSVLIQLAVDLFGTELEYRWVSAYFPFTHPSWELEVRTGVQVGDSSGGWTEMLGCGIVRQELLDRCDVLKKVGYAFGLGLERWAMKLYSIPDIRLFWSRDSGFLHQFADANPRSLITYKPISVFPACTLDISFWLPADLANPHLLTRIGQVSCQSLVAFEREFMELIRNVAGDLVEQVRLLDEFVDSKASRVSRCYRIVYRDHQRTLTTDEVNLVHQKICQHAMDKLNVIVR